MSNLRKFETYTLPLSVGKDGDIKHLRFKGFVPIEDIKDLAKNKFNNSNKIDNYLYFVRTYVDRYKYGSRCYYNKNEAVFALSAIITGDTKQFSVIQDEERLRNSGWMTISEVYTLACNYAKDNFPDSEKKIGIEIYNLIVNDKNVKTKFLNNKIYYWKDDVINSVEYF